MRVEIAMTKAVAVRHRGEAGQQSVPAWFAQYGCLLDVRGKPPTASTMSDRVMRQRAQLLSSGTRRDRQHLSTAPVSERRKYDSSFDRRRPVEVTAPRSFSS